ncbi:MAG: phage replisome organizer N-terminal domain-containing protein [Candidatus Aenigmatarchaeota archaeon]
MKKNYWIKLNKDFFDMPEIKILESQNNGPQYLLFYLKILTQSIEKNGLLRVNESIAYNNQSLAAVTGVNVDIVKQAIVALTNLNLITIEEDSTIIVVQANELLDGETQWAEYKRKQRNKAIDTTKKPYKLDNVQKTSKKCPTDIDIDIDKDIDKKVVVSNYQKKQINENENENNLNDFSYINFKTIFESNNFTFDLEKFYNYYKAKDFMLGKERMSDIEAVMKVWQSNENPIPKNKNTKGVAWEEPAWLDEIINNLGEN